MLRMPGPGSQPAEADGPHQGGCNALCVMQRWVSQGFGAFELRDARHIRGNDRAAFVLLAVGRLAKRLS